MRTEGLELVVEDEAVREVAAVAFTANEMLENIGARRLHTVPPSLKDSEERSYSVIIHAFIAFYYNIDEVLYSYISHILFSFVCLLGD